MARPTPSRVRVGERREVRHVLRVDLNGGRALAVNPAPPGDELADQRFDAGVDVGAVERGQPGVDEARHVVEGAGPVDVAVTARELPPALDHA